MAIEPASRVFSLPTIALPIVDGVPKAANDNGRVWPLIHFPKAGTPPPEADRPKLPHSNKLAHCSGHRHRVIWFTTATCESS